MRYLLLRTLKIGVFIYLGYLALVLLVAMPLLNALLPDLYRQQTGRELRSGELILNPFTLTASLQTAASPDADGRPLWSLQQLVADVSLASAWRGGLVFDRLLLHGVTLRIEETAPGRYNFSDIVDYRQAHFPPQPEPEQPTALPLIAFDQLLLGIARFDYRSPHAAEPLTLALDGLRLTIADFTTRPDGATPDAALPPLASGAIGLGFDALALQSLRAEEPYDTRLDQFQLNIDHLTTVPAPGQPYQLVVRDEGGGHLAWQGELALAEGRSEGHVQLERISLRPLWRYLAPRLNFRADGAELDVAANYRIDWGKTPLAWSIADGSVALREVALDARGETEIDKDTRSRIAFEQLALTGIAADGVARSASLDDVRLTGLQLRSWDREGQIGLLPMLTLRDEATTSPAQPTPAQPTGADNSEESWQLTLNRAAVEAARIDWRTDQLDVEQLNLSPLDASVENLTWPSRGPAQVSASARLNEQVQFSAAGELDPGSLDATLQGELAGLPLTWGNRQLGQFITASLADGTLATQWQFQLKEGQPARLQAAGSVDDFRLLSQPRDRRLLDWKQLVWRDLVIDFEAGSLELAEIELKQPFARFHIARNGSNNFQRLVIPPAESPATAEPAAAAELTGEKPADEPAAIEAINIARIVIDDSTLDFRDNSLPRPFHATIGEFSGEVVNLGNAPGQQATVDLAGSVDGYAPVTLSGSAAPLAEQPSIDLALVFNNLDLATFTPYSSTYAGYTIDRGLLTVQLAYQLEGNRIHGKNRVIANQLRLGEKVESPKAMDLPLRLAIALLTDSRGVMDLGVDISGDIDDPQFDLGDIVWTAFRNLIVKAVTAPFRLLAGLVGSESDLGHVDFQPGSDALDEAARGRLVKLKEALDQRPALRLGVVGRTDPATDGAVLRERHLQFMLMRQAGIDESDISERSRAWERALQAAWAQQFPDQEIDERSPEQLAAELQAALPLPANALRTLATNRAQAVKRVLVADFGMASERVFIDNGAGDKPESGPRASFKVDG